MYRDDGLVHTPSPLLDHHHVLVLLAPVQTELLPLVAGGNHLDAQVREHLSNLRNNQK